MSASWVDETEVTTVYDWPDSWAPGDDAITSLQAAHAIAKAWWGLTKVIWLGFLAELLGALFHALAWLSSAVGQ